MKSNKFFSIRWKILLYFVCGMGLALATIIFVLFASWVAEQLGYPQFLGLIQYVARVSSRINRFGPLLITFFVAGILVIFYFILLSRGMIRYIEKISRSLDTIAARDLKHRIPVLTNDELGNLARNINSMTAKLQKSLEEERKAEQAKYELITNVSHDLRTPLTSILGYLDLISERRYKDEGELLTYTQVAFAKAKRLQKLIDDLFEYTKFQGGSISLTMGRINVGDMMEQLVGEYMPLLEKAGLECRMAPGEEKLFVLADGDKLARVFENLISNAIRYGQNGRCIQIKWSRDKDEAVIDVVNYGAPIPADELPHIFERFYRVDKSRAEQFGGAGLGLAIARQIMELHQGTITACSHQDETKFTVRLKTIREV